MPRAKESLKIVVSQSIVDEVRTIQITLNAPAQEFLLSDLLSQRGALTSFETILKQAVKDATENYKARTEELIAGIAGGQQVNTSIPRPEHKSISKRANSIATKRVIAPSEKSAKAPYGEHSGSTSANADRND